MVTLEQVEKLREKANVSYDEAKAALEAANGDLLEALIALEKQGKVGTPDGGGFYSSDKGRETQMLESCMKKKHKNCEEGRTRLRDMFADFGRFCAKMLHKGNVNSFDVMKHGEVKASLSITVLLLLLICFFWVTVPLLVIGLFFGFRYRFRGPDLGRDIVNNAMDNAADAAETIKRSVSGDNNGNA